MDHKLRKINQNSSSSLSLFTSCFSFLLLLVRKKMLFCEMLLTIAQDTDVVWEYAKERQMRSGIVHQPASPVSSSVICRSKSRNCSFSLLSQCGPSPPFSRHGPHKSESVSVSLNYSSLSSRTNSSCCLQICWLDQSLIFYGYCLSK